MQSLQEILESFYSLIEVIIPIIIALALIFFLWGVALFILNAGNDEKREEGKKKMIWGIIALTVMVGIWGIVEFLIVAFNVPSADIILPSY